jgi:hypothetical protein
MPAISFFADEQDVKQLLNRLNADPEIAFIVPDGPLDPEEALANQIRASMGEGVQATFYLPLRVPDTGYRQRWKAVGTLDSLKDGNHSLWHVPAGPLPLLAEGGSEQVIPDSWQGWTEKLPGAGMTVPFFGPGHPADIQLELWARHRPYSEAEKASLPALCNYWLDDRDILVVSDFGWIGDLYGQASQSTWGWWKALEAWVAENAARIGHFTDIDDDTGEQTSWSFWAFPSALQKLKAGMAYNARGWELGEGIRTANTPGPVSGEIS